MDANGCSQNTAVTVNNSTGVAISNITPDNAICGASNGSIEVTVSGGTAPYQYSSDGGTTYSAPQPSTTYTFSGLPGGPYTISVLDASSCADNQATSVGITQMTVTSTTNGSICFGDSILYGNTYYSNAGLYPDSLLASNGCDSIAYLDLSIDAFVTGNTSVSICANESYVMPLGENVTGPGTYTDTIAGSSCDSIVTVNISLLPYPTGQVNVPICTGGSYTMPLGEVITTAGTYVDTIPAFDCDSIVTVVVDFDAFTQGSEDIALCPGETYTMPLGQVVSSPGSYLDTIPGFSCDSIVTVNITSLNYGMGVDAVAICPGASHTLPSGTIVSTGGVFMDTIPGFLCDSIITVAVTALLHPNGFVNQAICTGDSATINGTDHYYTTGVFSDTVAGARCDSIVTLNLTVTTPAATTITQTICEGSSATINGTDFYTTAGIYTDTLTGSQCDSFVTLILTVNQQLMIDNIATTNVNCHGDDGQVSITHSGSAGPVTYAITDNNSNTSTHTSSVIDLGAGDYTVVLTDSIGCTGQGFFTIGQDSLEGFDLTPASSSIFLGESIVLEANPAIGEFTWSPPFFLSCETCAKLAPL